MKHLLFLMSDLEGGGAEKALIELLKSIDYKCYKVSLCLILYRGIYIKDVPEEVELICLNGDEHSRRYHKAFMSYIERQKTYPLFYFLHTKLKRLRYDAIISFMEGDPLLLHHFIASRGRINITWVHCDLYHYHYSKNRFCEPIAEVDCYKKMDKIVFVSQIAMKNFDNLFVVNTSKSFLYNVLDVDRIRILANEKRILKERFTIIAIGSLNEVKGFDRLIRVAKKLKDEGCSFCIQILGKGGKEKELLDLRDELGVGDEVQFLGFQINPYPYLKQSDILVSTSASEGLSYVICEAFALGIPVVATKTAGALELLDHGKYGVLVDHDDKAIYLGIRRMMDSSELRKQYGEEGKGRADIFTGKRVVDEFYKLLFRKNDE